MKEKWWNLSFCTRKLNLKNSKKNPTERKTITVCFLVCFNAQICPLVDLYPFLYEITRNIHEFLSMSCPLICKQTRKRRPKVTGSQHKCSSSVAYLEKSIYYKFWVCFKNLKMELLYDNCLMCQQQKCFFFTFVFVPKMVRT